jgi:vitamin B12 transport system substrate-binding protein
LVSDEKPVEKHMKKIISHLLALSFLTLSIASTFANANEEKPTIIALSPHIVEMLYDIGAGEQIIGTTSFADYPEQAKSIPVIGNYLRLQIEKVISLQPDYIIAWKSGNPSDDLARLKQLGFNIVYSQPNSFEDIAKEMREFGALTGHKAQAESKAKQLLIDLEKITDQYHDKTSITVFYELWARPLTTVAKGSWPQQFLDICKAQNPFKKASAAYPQINIETVLLTPIQLIIQPLSVNQTDKEAYAWENWPIIPAVANKQIIQPDADAIHRMTMRSLNELTKLCAEIDETRQLLLHKKTL